MLLFFSSFAVAQTEEEIALKHWELVQKNYPQSVEFRKIGDREYYLENEGFYSGSVKIQNIIIEESSGIYKKTVDFVVKLETDEKTLYKEHGQSYSRWQGSNRLIYDETQKRWVRYKDYDISANRPYSKKACSKKQRLKTLWEKLLVAAFPLILIVLIFFVFLRTTYKDGKSINERLLDSNLEIANELKRIADQLEKDR